MKARDQGTLGMHYVFVTPNISFGQAWKLAYLTIVVVAMFANLQENQNKSFRQLHYILYLQ